MAMDGTMIVPDSTVSVSFNLATYRGEQGFSGAAVLRLTPRVYVSGGIAGSTVKGSTGGRVGVAFGFCPVLPGPCCAIGRLPPGDAQSSSAARDFPKGIAHGRRTAERGCGK